MIGFILFCIFAVGFAVAVLYLTIGLKYDIKLYSYLKNKKNKRFEEIYSLNSKGALFMRVWRYIYDNSDMNDKTVKSCKTNLRISISKGSIGVFLVALSFAIESIILFLM